MSQVRQVSFLASATWAPQVGTRRIDTCRTWRTCILHVEARWRARQEAWLTPKGPIYAAALYSVHGEPPSPCTERRAGAGARALSRSWQMARTTPRRLSATLGNIGCAESMQNIVEVPGLVRASNAASPIALPPPPRADRLTLRGRRLVAQKGRGPASGNAQLAAATACSL